MDDMDNGKIDVLVVYKVDRLSRSLLDFAQVMRRFNAANVSFVSVTQNFNTADAMGRLTLNMLMSFSEFEREMIAERTRDKVAAARRRGKWTGGPVPIGYDVVEKKLIINELEAETVREMYRLYLAKRSALTVMKTLNNQGRATKRHVSNNGRVRQSRAILDGNTGAKRKRARNPDYILRGIIRCECCGAAFTTASTRKNGTEFRYYRCVTRDKQGREACPSKPLPAQAIEDFVTARIREAVRTRDLTGTVADAVLEMASRHRASFERERKLLPAKIAQLAAEGKALVGNLDEVEGNARRMVEQSLEEKGTCLVGLEARLIEVERYALSKPHLPPDVLGP